VAAVLEAETVIIVPSATAIAPAPMNPRPLLRLVVPGAWVFCFFVPRSIPIGSKPPSPFSVCSPYGY